MSARFRRQDGAALPLALAFVSLFALLIGALLSFSETGLKSARSIAGQGDEVTAADGAVQGAIARLRPDLAAGVEGSSGTCFAPPAINGVSVTVRCEGKPGSGAVTGGGGSSSSVPSHAILTLGTGAGGEHGFVKKVGGSSLSVGGTVFSNSTIDVTGDLNVTGSVQALGACSGTIVAPSTKCSNTGGGANPAQGTDPVYSPAVATAPVARTVPSCGSGWLVTFAPGTYADVSGMNDLFKGTGCSGKVFWFQPGVYYFPFDEAWTINDATANVVAGTPQGWSTSAGSRPTIAVPGGCDKSAAGVQFIFGGRARLDVQSGLVEVCPQPHDDQQRIAIYGIPPSGVATTSATLTPSSASTPATTPAFSPATSGRLIDGSTASVAPSSTNPGWSRSITLSGFGGLPSGALITSATLRVAHREVDTNRISSISASVQPASGPATTVPVSARSTLGTDSIDLLAAGMSPTTNATSFTLVYSVTAKNNQTTAVHLDGAELAFTYAASGFSAGSGCITATPYPSGAACALLSVSGTNAGVVIHGTVYAPAAAVDASTPNSALAMFRRGVIARTVQFSVPSSWGDGTAAVSVPSTGSTTADREVLLTAVIGGVDRLRATVRFADGGGATPGQTVTIQEWSVL